MIELTLKTTRSNFVSLLYCVANITDFTRMNWMARPGHCDASFYAGANLGNIVVWKGGKNIDLTINGQTQGEGIHWNIELTDYAIKA